MPILYLVVPCYNEEEVLPDTTARLSDKMNRMIASGTCSPESRILFVDDGSRDRTWELISQYHGENPLVCGLKLAHNRGHQNALLAGLLSVRERCDCAVSIDADLQDDIEVLDEFIARFQEGCEIVYGVRKKRETDTFFKRTTAQGFYRFMQKLGVDIVYNHADYRLMSRRALDALSEYGEVNLFLRGIAAHIGFKTASVFYDRSERLAGESKYPLKKMISFALDGITSFSTKPLKYITSAGIINGFTAVAALLAELICVLCSVTVAGWLVALAALWLLGSMQLIALGIVGGYVGKIYAEAKHRPRFYIDSMLLH